MCKQQGGHSTNSKFILSLSAPKTLPIFMFWRGFSFLIVQFSNVSSVKGGNGSNSLSVADCAPLALKTTQARCAVVDKVEATKNLKRYNVELDKWLALERSLMTFDEMQTVDRKIETLKAWIKNIYKILHT